MEDQNFERVAEIFGEARTLSGPNREQFLNEACAGDEELRREVDELLDFHEDETAGIEGSVEEIVGEIAQAAQSPGEAPISIGPYRILRSIGEGGMGIVYEAEQDVPRRRVALKVIRPGLASDEVKKRFQIEAEILGRLQHPGIAQIHDAGVAQTDKGEQPFFAMELVDGEPLNRAASRLSKQGKLELLEKIGHAVEHAHLKGVVHRDLKPANILITRSKNREESEPKILDFGVARVTGDDLEVTSIHTEAGRLIGTMLYMSPEQVSGRPEEIDTQTDVWALGVLAYELLTGKTPHDLSGKSLPEAARAIADTDVRALGTVDRSLRGDIEAVVGKALERDKTRRYRNAGEFADDLRRVLDDEPVEARQLTTFYQIGKFARRNRVLVLAASTVFIAIVGGATWALIEAQRARQAEELAARRFQSANTVAVFWNDLLEGVDPRRDGEHVRVRTLLDRTAASIDSRFADEPHLQASLHETVGSAYGNLGLHSLAKPHLHRAVEISKQSGETDNEIYARRLSALGWAIMGNSRQRAERLLRDALALRLRVHGDQHALVAESYYLLGHAVPANEAIAEFNKALEMYRQISGERSEGYIKTLRRMARHNFMQGDFKKAHVQQQKSYALARSLWGESHPDISVSLALGASIALAQGDHSEAIALQRRVIKISTELLGPDHSGLAPPLSVLSDIYLVGGDATMALKTSSRAVEIARRAVGSFSWQTAQALFNRGNAYYALKQIDEASADFEESLDIRRRQANDKPMALASSLLGLAMCQRWKARHTQSLESMKEAISICRENLGEESLPYADAIQHLGVHEVRHGDRAEGKKLLLQSRATFARVLGHELHSRIAKLDHELAMVHFKEKDWDTAEKLALKSIDTFRKLFERDHVDTLFSYMLLSDIEAKRRNWVKSEAHARQAKPLGRKQAAAWVGAAIDLRIAAAAMQQDRLEEARDLLFPAVDVLAEKVGAEEPRTQRALTLLVSCLTALGEVERADEYRKRIR